MNTRPELHPETHSCLSDNLKEDAQTMHLSFKYTAQLVFIP